MMKKLFCLLLAVCLMLFLAACRQSPAIQAAPDATGSAPPDMQEMAEAEYKEMFGFRIPIHALSTSDGMEDGTYDINFGETEETLEGFISISPPERAPGLSGTSAEDKERMASFLESAEMYSNFLSQRKNQVGEVRELAGQTAYYYGVEGVFMGLNIRYEVYNVLDREAVYSVIVMRYLDSLTQPVSDAMDATIAAMEFVAQGI